MLNAAEKMKTLGRQPSDTGAPTSIFGSAAGLAQTIQTDEQYRIGMYPILCQEMPEVAMGLASCLCYLLEQYDDTRVYRCFARIGETDENTEITTSDYQFRVADWEMDGLADNVTLDGAFRRDSGRFELSLAIDASLSLTDDDSFSLDYEFESLAAAVTELPAVAENIYRRLAGDSNTVAIIEYSSVPRGLGALESLLESVFGWNLDVFLYLWDVEWEEDEIRDQFQEVADLCKMHSSEFAYWCLGMLAKQAMQPGISDIGEIVVPLVRRAFSPEMEAAAGASAASLGMSKLGHAQSAIAFLRPFLRNDADASVWRAMTEILLDSGHFDEAIDNTQLALESGLQHPALYWQYAQLLMAAEVNSWSVQDVLLIDPDEHNEEEHITVEIANALKLFINESKEDLGALQLALTYMIDANDDELWIYFERLSKLDDEGALTGDIIDRLIELEDYDRAYDILERQLDSNPYAYVHLAQLALVDTDSAMALELIEACRAKFAEIDDDLELELQRIKLQATLPLFDARYAEIKVILSANRPVSEDQVDLLEQAIEHAPKLVDLHLLLSQCYRSWRDADSAFEVLREAEQLAGSDPKIDLGLVQILWDRNEREDAVSKLNDALERFPRDVYLLAQMANCLIENNQFEDARQYIARAETIAPSHRAIWQVRRLVAQKMAE
ncbi:MAG: tetratricopeptide repeat protein [Chloroflexi bacterium]|nr:tetratricopeptide repeat protein [Chloroflexota bacterium]